MFCGSYSSSLQNTCPLKEESHHHNRFARRCFSGVHSSRFLAQGGLLCRSTEVATLSFKAHSASHREPFICVENAPVCGGAVLWRDVSHSDNGSCSLVALNFQNKDNSGSKIPMLVLNGLFRSLGETAENS
ncbi:hypothetical protein CEXT_491691 [Caerostris extrusa]|uniref:Uncharacterized protein n=1 Tax=Caerostris extrusa TaxID=172846 RepID=A0AAV4U2X0_CAEEX|nr:hypothetical protein CEXT_491691 [Caerostris extrusa]